jgi:hypothetical protein
MHRPRRPGSEEVNRSSRSRPRSTREQREPGRSNKSNESSASEHRKRAVPPGNRISWPSFPTRRSLREPSAAIVQRGPPPFHLFATIAANSAGRNFAGKAGGDPHGLIRVPVLRRELSLDAAAAARCNRQAVRAGLSQPQRREQVPASQARFILAPGEGRHSERCRARPRSRGCKDRRPAVPVAVSQTISR